MRYSFSTNINLLLSLILLLLKYFILLKPLIPYLYHSSSSIDFAIFSLHISSSFSHVLANSFDIEFIYWWRIGIFYYANNIRQKSDYILKKTKYNEFSNYVYWEFLLFCSIMICSICCVNTEWLYFEHPVQIVSWVQSSILTNRLNQSSSTRGGDIRG